MFCTKNIRIIFENIIISRKRILIISRSKMNNRAKKMSEGTNKKTTYFLLCTKRKNKNIYPNYQQKKILLHEKTIVLYLSI